MTKTQRTSAMIKPASLGRARIAASILQTSILDFVSEATDKAATAVIKKHGVKLPPELATADASKA
jgi:uncharacterized protein (DUF1778 family)